MKESVFQTRFNKWLIKNWHTTAVFELKICKGKSLPFASVRPHQIRSLKLAKNRIIYKIPDVGYDQKPFDSLLIAKAEAYVVIMFYKRGQREFVMIDVNEFEKFISLSDRKSLTEEEAKLIGNVYEL